MVRKAESAFLTEELFVVPSERHVARLAREGARGETLTALRTRLASALLPDVRFADARETRLTLAIALEEVSARGGQLHLFGGGEAAADPLLTTLRDRGGASWVRAVSSIDQAIGELRSRGATEAHLGRVRGSGVAAARARTLAAAMRTLDETLARAGARDGRLVGLELAAAIRRSGASTLTKLLNASRVRARWVLAWDPDDLAWWRALDEMLARRGGFARVVLPSFDKRLEGARDRDPLEVLSDAVALRLDAAPEMEILPAVFGDLASVGPEANAASRVRLVRAHDARSEARVVADIVKNALAEGARVERIAIAYPARDERTLLPLRRELAAEGIVFHDAFGVPPLNVPVIAAARRALVAADSLDRVAVARVLRSGYVDAPRVLGSSEDGGELMSFGDAEKVLSRLAHELETRATAAGVDAASRLVRTAAPGGGEDEPPARRVVSILERARVGTTRGARVRAARGLFMELGFASRAGRGALRTFARDETPAGLDRAEQTAVARDLRAWEALEGALDLYETVAILTGATDRPLDAEVFRLELDELLESSSRRPGAGHAGAVRVTHLADVVGEPLDLLVVLDANDGVLPRDVRPVTLVSDALEEGALRAAQGAFVPMTAHESGARDLAALAVASAEATAVVLVTTAEEGIDAPASPSRVFLALERAGVKPTNLSSQARLADESSDSAILRTSAEVLRRVDRERKREGFFLDPMRPRSDIVGALLPNDEIARVVTTETGATPDRALAVTSVERFAQCAFKGYAHVVLAAREGEEQQELPDAREEGNLGHDALAAAFRATREEWSRRPRDAVAIIARGLEAADVSLSASAVHAPLRAIVRLRVRESVRAVLLRAIADEEWDFILAEQAFGKGKPWPPFHVAGDRVNVWLRGSIDRVDRSHDGRAARVVDYKRSMSTVRASSSSSLGESAIQVPLYAVVAATRLEVPATGAYVPMQARDVATATHPRRAPSPGEDRIAELARRAAPTTSSEIERRVLAIATSVRSGLLAPLPARESECLYCGVSGGCRKPRFAMAPSDEIGEAGEKEP